MSQTGAGGVGEMVQDGISLIQDLRDVNGLIIEFLLHNSNS